MTTDPGAVALSVLRLLTFGPRPPADVRAAISQYPDARVADALERLQRDGLVHTHWKRLELTAKGRAIAPVTSPDLASHGTYRPERVVRRIGTEVHKRLPSMRGGRLFYQEQA
jgi:hypothetical protein